jgi:hypothetical protein
VKEGERSINERQKSKVKEAKDLRIGKGISGITADVSKEKKIGLLRAWETGRPPFIQWLPG